MSNWEVIREEWENSEITFKDLAEKYGLKDSTIRSRKNREKWQRNGATQRTSETKNVATKKEPHRAPKGNQYAKGNRGNPKPKPRFSERNTEALKHGLFSRYMPEETLNIMGMIAGSDPASLLWMQIELQFAAIIRAQQIMFVKDQEDTTKELKREKDGYSQTGSSSEREYEIQFAWDKHGAFLNAQSRAMAELRSSIKQFEELIEDKNDERMLRLEIMQQQIEKGKLEISHMRGDTDGDAHEQGSSYEDALNAQVEDVFADEVIDDAEA